MLTFKSRNLDLRGSALRDKSSRRRNAEPAGRDVALEWCPFVDEPGGKLKFPEQKGVSLELHLLQDEEHFLPVWLIDGVVVATLDPADA